jgi:hypothetical protein
MYDGEELGISRKNENFRKEEIKIPVKNCQGLN